MFSVELSWQPTINQNGGKNEVTEDKKWGVISKFLLSNFVVNKYVAVFSHVGSGDEPMLWQLLLKRFAPNPIGDFTLIRQLTEQRGTFKTVIC